MAINLTLFISRNIWNCYTILWEIIHASYKLYMLIIKYEIRTIKILKFIHFKTLNMSLNTFISSHCLLVWVMHLKFGCACICKMRFYLIRKVFSSKRKKKNCPAKSRKKANFSPWNDIFKKHWRVFGYCLLLEVSFVQ